MASRSVTAGGISMILNNPSPDSSADVPEIVLQVVDLKPLGNTSTRFTFMANDGNMKLKAMLPTNISSEVNSGKLQNLGLIRILDYTCNSIPNQSTKALIVTKCEVVSPALEGEIKEDDASKDTKANVQFNLPVSEAKVKSEVKLEGTGITLKPKQELVAKSAAQIMHEQRSNAAPSARLAMTRRVHPLASLNPYQGSWTIKVRVTDKGTMRTYKNPRGEGCVFNVELTDEDGTQIQATMFNEAARKFYTKFDLGKVYYISRGTLKVANKQFATVRNDYEMTLNENSEVEEVAGVGAFLPETKYNFVKIDQLGQYVNGRELVDIVGIVQNVSTAVSIRRKSNNDMIPKRDITITDESKKTVVVSLWNDLATNVGQELLDALDASPVVAIKNLKVGDFQGVTLSTLGKSTITVNPDVPDAKVLRSWYDSEGKGATLAPVGAGLVSTSKGGLRSMYSDRVLLSTITSDQNLGEDKPVFFSIKVDVTFIKPDQTMWYRACKVCNKKVTESVGSGYWCEGCQRNGVESSLRYILVVKVSDSSGEAWLSLFNEHAEKIMGCSADELDMIKSEKGMDSFQLKLKEATWVPHLFRVSVAVTEYMGEKRQRITVRAESPMDYSAESRYLLDEISKLAV